MKAKKLLSFASILLLAGCQSTNPATAVSTPTRESSTSSIFETTSEVSAPSSTETGINVSSLSTQEENTDGHRVLMVYFSASGSDTPFEAISSGASVTSIDGDFYGNTETIAKYIEDETHYDYFKINTVEAYPNVYNDLATVAKNQLDNGIYPEIKNLPSQETINGYDTILLGHPIWWYDLPMPVASFLKNYDWTGKNIYDFFTHQGSSSGASSASTIQKLVTGSTFHDDNRLSVSGQRVSAAKETTLSWLKSLSL